MAIPIVFYEFAKKPNSTARPADGVVYQCEIIDPSTVTNPTIYLTVQKPINFNYCYINDFKRYYFINEWAWRLGRWEASLSVDVLASYKDEIGASIQYVTRSETRGNGYIVDNMYPATTQLYRAYSEANDFPFNPTTTFSDGYYIIGVMGSGGSGSVVYYAMTSSQLETLVDVLLGNIDWWFEGIDEIGQDLAKIIFNPLDYIVGCRWMPILSDGLGTSFPVSDLPLGWWTLPGVSARRLANSVITKQFSIPLPNHPQISRGQYLNYKPYTVHTIDFPPFGSLDVPSECVSSGVVNVRVDYSLIDGSCNCYFLIGDNYLYKASSNISVQVQLSSIRNSAQGALAQFAISALDNLIPAINENVSVGASAAIGAAYPPEVRTSGGNGGGCVLRIPSIMTTCQYIVDDSPSHYGKPLCQDVQISNLSGYIRCGGAEIAINCTSQEMETIISFMDSGFYYE